MKTIHLYDPALCCSSGVCGPGVDPELVRVQSDLEWLKSKGVTVERHNLVQQPADFAANDTVRERLLRQGESMLPLTMIDSEIAAAGFYPTRKQFAKLTGVALETETADSASCCSSSEGCCA